MATPKKSTPKSRALSRSASRAAGASRAAARKTSAKQDRAAVSRSIAKPGKVSESGTAWGSITKAAVAAARKYGNSGPASGKTVGSSISGGIVPRTKSVQKWESRAKRVNKGK